LTITGESDVATAAVLREVVPAVSTLPLRLGPQAQLSPKAAATLGTLSQRLHDYLDSVSPADLDGRRSEPGVLADALRAEKRGKKPAWLRPEAIPTMLQLLRHEDTPVRRMLVEMLADIEGPAATAALARLAVFDLDAKVRAQAVGALKGRPAADARPIFLAALRYPWPQPADHAAEALIALRDKTVIPTLVTLLKEPDPASPRKHSRGGYTVQELVRAAHRANCLMCHPPAITGNEPVQGLDPVNTVASRTAVPGSSGRGGAWSGGGATVVGQSPLVIRADITFLRQDFSVQLPAARLPVAPADGRAVRFDFLVRTRWLTKAEAARVKDDAPPTSYPQREAVLFALRELTGQDAGATTEAWVRLYPRAQTEVEAARLAEKLVAAGPVRLGQLLGQARDGDEEVCIQGLAAALTGLKGLARDRVEEALVGRLACLDADGLRSRLHEKALPLRQAAVAACGRLGDMDLVPDLIALLENDPPLATLATKGLQALTGERFTKASEWRGWWEGKKLK
jgi:HEAT repeat protein